MSRKILILMCKNCGKMVKFDHDGLNCECGGFLEETTIILLEGEIQQVEDIRG